MGLGRTRGASLVMIAYDKAYESTLQTYSKTSSTSGPDLCKLNVTFQVRRKVLPRIHRGERLTIREVRYIEVLENRGGGDDGPPTGNQNQYECHLHDITFGCH